MALRVGSRFVAIIYKPTRMRHKAPSAERCSMPVLTSPHFRDEAKAVVFLESIVLADGVTDRLADTAPRTM